MRGVSLLFNLIKLFGITFHFVFSSRNVLQSYFQIIADDDSLFDVLIFAGLIK